MSTNNIKFSQVELETLIERYFDAVTNEVEEEMLRYYLASGKYRMTKTVREALAVLSIAAQSKQRVTRKHSNAWIATVSVAASIALIISVAIHFNNNKDICKMYIAGVQISDKEVIMQMIQNDLSIMNATVNQSDNIVGDQLSDIMNLIEDNTSHNQ